MTTKMKVSIGVFVTATGLLVWGYITDAQWLQITISVLSGLVG
jgi:hypothetical protein